MKQRYSLDNSIEVWKLYGAIKNKKLITFQELKATFDKDGASISGQMKPLILAKIVIREGSGKRGHPATYRLANNKEYNCPCCGKVI